MVKSTKSLTVNQQLLAEQVYFNKVIALTGSILAIIAILDFLFVRLVNQFVDQPHNW